MFVYENLKSFVYRIFYYISIGRFNFTMIYYYFQKMGYDLIYDVKFLIIRISSNVLIIIQ